MANIYDELAAANAQAAEEIAEFGKVSDGTAQRLTRANAAIADFDAKIQSVTRATGALYQTFTTYNRAVTDGVKGYKDLASTTDQLATSIEALSAALAFVLPIGRIAKVAIAGLGLLAGELVRSSKAIGEQIDGLRAGFDELAQVGGTTAGGLTDMFEAMQKVGLSTKDFPQFARALGEQSELLSRFGGTVTDGRNAVLGLSEDLRPMRNELQNFGIRLEQIGEASLGFIKIQKLSSLGSRSNMDISTKSMMSYVKELDTITRLTGISRKQQEKTMEEAMRNDAFAATIDEMRARGEHRQADLLMKNLAYYEKMGPTALKGYKDSISGFIGVTDEGTQLYQSSNGAVQDQIDKIKSGSIDTVEKLAESQKDVSGAISEVAETIGRGAAMLGTQFGLPYHELRNAIEGATADITAALTKIAQEQEKTDPLLKKNNEMLSTMQDNMIRNQAIIQGMTMSYTGAVDTVTGALDSLTNAAIEAAKALYGLVKPRAIDTSPKAIAATSAASKASAANLSQTQRDVMSGKYKNEQDAGLGRLEEAERTRKANLEDVLEQQRLRGYQFGNRPTEKVTSEQHLKDRGIPIKEGKTLKEGNELSPKLVSIMEQAAKAIPGFNRITGTADQYHEENKPNSKHNLGRAFDFTLTGGKPDANTADYIVQTLQGMGASLVLNEYAKLSPGGTGGHFHVEVPEFAEGGILGAGKLGLVGEKGPELITGPASITSNSDIMAALNGMVAALERSTTVLENINRNTSNTADSSDRMLRLAQN